jgi:hypothetical protein
MLVDRVLGKKRILGKNGGLRRAEEEREEEERHRGLLTPKKHF